MNIPELGATIIPFITSYAVAILGGNTKTIAASMLKLATPGNVVVGTNLRDLAVDLATSVHAQLSFVVSVLSAIVVAACWSLTDAPRVAALPVLALVLVGLGWVYRWHPTAVTEEVKAKRETEMFRASLAVITIMLIASVAARWSSLK